AGALAAFAAGLTFNGTMLMLNRAFFSLQSPWIPTIVALGNLGVNAALDAAFYRFGVWGIPLSTTFVNIAGASAVVAVVSYAVWRGLDTELGRSVGAQIVSLGLAIAGGVAAYALACRTLNVHELRALLSLRRRGA